jgi:hypothetical protein
MFLSPNEMAWCLIQAGFTGTDAATGLPHVVVGVNVGWQESKGDTDALGKVLTAGNSGNFDHGWMQVSNLWHDRKLAATPNWRDPLVNARLAKQVFDETAAINAKAKNGKSGWSAWSTYENRGTAFTLFVPHATLAARVPFPPAVPEYRPIVNVAPAPVNVTLDPRTIPLDISVQVTPRAGS